MSKHKSNIGRFFRTGIKGLILLFLTGSLLIPGCSKEAENLVPHTKYQIDGPYVREHPSGYDLITVDSEGWLRNQVITGNTFNVQSALDPELTFEVEIRDNIEVDPFEYYIDQKVLAVSDIEGNLSLYSLSFFFTMRLLTISSTGLLVTTTSSSSVIFSTGELTLLRCSGSFTSWKVRLKKQGVKCMYFWVITKPSC